MKVCTFGELLVDVTPYGTSDKGYPVCEFNPGGAPANVAVALNNLGVDASFVGQVGDDHYGRFLKSVLDSKVVDTSGLI
jgi:fructokinase